MFRTLRGLGVTPDHLAGHSYGELAALCAAGAMSTADLLEISAARGEAILAAAGVVNGGDPGTMAAVSAGESAIRGALNGQMSRGGVVIANLNSPEQTVISGPTASIDSAVTALKGAGISAQRIPVACAFHSPLVADASRTLEAELSRRQIGSPHLPVWANATAAPYPLGSSAVRELLADQVASPVRFAEQIEAMYAAGARVFVECGPGRVLTGLVGSILGDRPHLAVATDAPGKHGISALLSSLGRLLAAGVTADTDALYAGRNARIVSVQEVPRRPGWAVNGHLVRTAEGTPVANGLRPVQRVEIATAAPATPAKGTPAPAAQAPAVPSVSPVPSDGREAVVLEFLRSSREMIAAQRDVVLGFLGSAPAPVAQPAPGAQPAPIAASVDATAPVSQEAVAPAPIVEPASVVPPAPVAEAQGAPPPAAAPELTSGHVLTVLTELIAERTGYPAEMLGADLDLEADLSIASLKRTEILGLLADRLPGAGLDEDFQAQLSRIRTMAGMVEAIVGRAPVAAQAPANPAQAAPAPAPAELPAELSAERVLAVLTELIAERTGYPAEMLGADLDLEADLSIASLKRTEILGLLADRLPGAGLDEDFQAQLSRMRTMQAMVDAIVGTPAAASPVVAPVTTAAVTPVAEAPMVDREPIRRYLMELAPAEPVSTEGDLTGRHVTMVGGGLGIAIELADVLTARGATVRTVSTDPDTELGDVDILIHLGAAGPSEPPSLPDAFAVLRHAVLGGARQLLVVTGTGGRMGYRTATDAPPRSDAPAGMGLAGLVRTIAREYPHVSCRALDIDPKETAALLTTRLLAELVNPAGPEVVGYAEGVRKTLALVPAALESDARPTAAQLGLTPGSVVLLTGGARGITARAAAGLAGVSGCHIVLWGRSPLPAAEEDPATAGAHDSSSLRRALIGTGITVPAQVEREVARLMAEREIRSTLATLQAVAASVTYQAIDVRDAVAVQDGIAEVMARHGRIDGVVHGAGVLDDRLIADKSADGFARVWETKVDGARALAAALPSDLGFLVMFGSVSGVFGNRGQCDYAAANDALDCLARAWETRFTGRVLSVDWGPWLPTADEAVAGPGNGMVSAELLRSYARQGVGAIHPDDGVAALLSELAYGSNPQVVYVCAEPAAFDVAFSGGLGG